VHRHFDAAGTEGKAFGFCSSTTTSSRGGNKAGRHFTFATPDRSAFEFARVVCELAVQYRDADTVHLVLDNLNVHRLKSLTDAFGMEMGCEVWDRFTIHLTPKHESWLNQAEIEIGLFSRQCLGKRRIPDLKSLCRETRAWSRRMDRNKVKINWTFDRRSETRPSERFFCLERNHAVRALAAAR
jgi:DDE superfamily endonuclease